MTSQRAKAASTRLLEDGKADSFAPGRTRYSYTLTFGKGGGPEFLML